METVVNKPEVSFTVISKKAALSVSFAYRLHTVFYLKAFPFIR